MILSTLAFMFFLLYILLIFIFFYLDVLIASIYGYPFSALLVTLVAPYIIMRWSLLVGVPLIGLLCLESFLFQEIALLPFWYLVPVVLMLRMNSYFFCNNKSIMIMTAFFCSVVHQYMICGISLYTPFFFISNVVFAELVVLFYTKKELR